MKKLPLLLIAAVPCLPLGLLAKPAFDFYSTRLGDIPAPNQGAQQTATLVLDIDKDGADDFVITERTQAPAVVWYKFREGGKWDRYVVWDEPLHIEAGGDFHDIDGDGDLDILFCGDYKDDGVWWWENPYPDFDPARAWKRHTVKSGDKGTHQHDNAFGDFDGDGRVELAWWSQATKKLYLGEIPADPRNAEKWEYREIWSYTVRRGHEGMTTADMNGDGVVDIIGAGYWFEHKGDGTFAAHELIDRSFTRCATGQLIKGGQLEVVISPGDASGPVEMLEWKDDGWQRRRILDHIEHGHSLGVRDIDADGHLDVFVAEMGKPGAGPHARTMIFWGDGKGHFRMNILAVGIANHEARLGDFNGDGRLDILGKPYSYGAPGVHVWLQRETKRGMQDWNRVQVDSLPHKAVFVLAGDLDGDGDLDIASGGWWWEQKGSLSEWERHGFGEPLNNLACLLDVDGDGDLDALGTTGKGADANHEFVWARNDGKGGFEIVDARINYHEQGDFLQGCAVADFGQGKQVVLSWHRGGGGIQALNIPADPAKDEWKTIRITSTMSNPPQSEDVEVGDIDRDGDLDLLIGPMWIENHGGGSFSTHVLGEIPEGEADRVELVDLDGDGRLDAVISLEKGQDIWAFFAPEDPAQPWNRARIDTVAGQGFSMDSGDFDGDGEIDIVVGEHRGESENRVLIFSNDGGGRKWRKHVIDSGPKTEIDHHDGTQAYDLDRDGDLDVISIGWYNPKLWVFENTAPRETAK